MAAWISCLRGKQRDDMIAQMGGGSDVPKVPYCGRSMFYQEAGEGPVLIFLHGNTASSRLFEPLLPLYTPHFRCVLLDFLGNGRSDRVESFPADLWQEEARQALALSPEDGRIRDNVAFLAG